MTPLEPWAPDGVQRVDLEQGPSWVARTHGPARPGGAMPSAVLQWLAAGRKATELVVERTRQAFEALP